jgi:hypothetical protein
MTVRWRRGKDDRKQNTFAPLSVDKSKLLLAKNILRGGRVKGCGHDRDLCEPVLAREALRGKGWIVGLEGGEVGGGGERGLQRERED